MQSVRALLRHLLARPLVRYGVAGAGVALVYLSVPLAVNRLLAVRLEVAIILGYGLAVTLHFNLQRRFVFRHIAEFALSRRQQIGRYVAIGAVQYPTTAAATALLPKVLGVSDRMTFVLVTLTMSGTFFLVLRGQVFHPDTDDQLIAEVQAQYRADCDEAVDPDGSRHAQNEPDPVGS